MRSGNIRCADRQDADDNTGRLERWTVPNAQDQFANHFTRIDTTRCALLVIDMQNSFLTEGEKHNAALLNLVLMLADVRSTADVLGLIARSTPAAPRG